jgi:DNA/RNA-binding domain of Phe-tRNA-synthetase-like protein
MNEAASLEPTAGFIEARLHDEFPGLRLDWITLAARRRGSPRSMVRRLKDLSSRYRGADVVTMRTKAIPQAYRAFFRQIGLDPDVTRIPSEQVAVTRLLHGGFRSTDLISDACLVALIETGVPVWALDADAIEPGGLGIRTTDEHDAARAAARGGYLPVGSLAVADADTVHGLLFGELTPGHTVGARTRRVTLFAIGVDGVPAIHIEEALWMCVELVSQPSSPA